MTPSLFGDQPFDLAVPFIDALLASLHVGCKRCRLLFPLVQDVELPVEDGISLLEAALFPLDLLAPCPKLGLPRFAQPNDLLLSRDHGSGASTFRLALSFSYYPPARLLSRCVGRSLPGTFAGTSAPKADNGCNNRDKPAGRKGRKKREKHNDLSLQPGSPHGAMVISISIGMSAASA